MSGLYQPSRERFRELAAQHAIVPVWREVLADLTTPLAVYDRIRSTAGPTFLLESVEHGERWGRYSFIGLRPFCELRARDQAVTLLGEHVPETAVAAAATGDPLATLDALVAALRTPELAGLPPLFAGAVGYIGYDVVRFIERLPDSTTDDLGFDDVRLLLPGQLIAFDHLRQRLLVVTNVRITGEGGAEGSSDPDASYDAAVTASEQLVGVLGQRPHAPPVAPPRAATVVAAHANMTAAHYRAAVVQAKEYIAAGDAFQVVPSQRFSLDTVVDPFTVYRVLRVINPSPYMYFFDWDDLQIVGSSPEALVTLTGRDAQIWPIAGSRPRGADEADDATLEADLVADTKERAEHIMLVDLARNDLGRVCERGSVRVAELMSVVRYSHIMHLESRVEGRVEQNLSAVDVLRATFPAGTLTGAPKVRAMEIIDELEPTRRGPYGGGIGYLDFAGNLDLCIAIRTLMFADGRAHVQAGAGVVADSDPATEFAETRSKAMALLAAVRAAEALAADHDPAAVPATAGGDSR